MEESIQYYKVVRVSDRGLVSSFSGLGPATVVYIPGEWVSAPPGLAAIRHDLCVYVSENQAQQMCYGTRWLQLWVCECEGVHEPTLYSTMDYFINGRSLERAIAMEFPSVVFAMITSLCGWPLSTMMAERVKLVERIY